MDSGEAILSAFLEPLLGKLLEVELVAVDLDEEIKSLKETLDAISIIIADAEEMQGENPIKLWLQHLREESYNASDVLDEVAYEALRREHVNLPKVRNSYASALSVRRLIFENSTSKKITKISNALEKLVTQSSTLNLRKGSGSRTTLNASETGSVGEENVLGRERDSDIILKYLLSNEWSTNTVDFVAVLGKAGLGKTTLARVVFNDDRVIRHFNVRMWVHALAVDEGSSFGEKELLKAIIESFTQRNCDLPSLDIMQQHLTSLLERIRYLLVLDGLSNDRPEFLDGVRNFLSRVGATGSKVLITTQKRSICKIICTTHTHELMSISNDDCAKVIRKFAFSDRNANAHPDLNKIIDTIVDKCDGLPLAAKRYGMLLSVKTERSEWELISRKEVGEVIDYDVTRTLSSDVKRCFAYCSIFPRGFLFDKEQLIQLWLAQDFVPNEDEGSRCFDTMFQCSLFRHAPLDHTQAKEGYFMDSDIRSRAQLISGEECYPDNTHILSEITRHASLPLIASESTLHLSRNSSSSHSRRNTAIDIEYFYKAKGLYTLILLAHPSNPVRVHIPKNLAEKLQRLRSLDLSNTDLLELPSSIGGLKHLRYLALHNAKIRRLPNSLCELYLLQTLGLGNCYELIELPKDTRHLVNLRHLDLHLDDDSRRSGSLTSMPREMGKLTNLRTLSRFVVSRGERCGISELRDMEHLRGNLTIVGLESVDSVRDAKEASLDVKEHLQMLELRWDEDERDARGDVEVLGCLRPHVNIREIRIGGYLGYSLASWIGDPSFTSLAVLKLYKCMNLSELPPLDQLRALKTLQLESLPNWQSWSGRDDRALPSLQELSIRDCVNLYQVCPSLPILLRLEIDRCPRILGLPVFPSLQSLRVKDCGDWILKSLSSLKSVSFLSLDGLPSATLPMGLQTCVNMRTLEVTNFVNLYSLPDDWLPVGLSRLKIENCPTLQSLPLRLPCLQHLQVLQVRQCQNLLILPMGMSSLRSLRYLELSDCPKLSFMPRDGLPDGIPTLIINNCHNVIQYLQQEWDFIMNRIREVWVNGSLLSTRTEAACSGSSSNPRQ